MRRRSLVVFLFSLSVVPTMAAPLPAVTIQVKISSGVIAPGQTATMTFTVSGSTEPVRIRLRNKTPAIGTLEGGNVQVAMTSGGTPNTVTRRVIGLSDGTFTMDRTLEPRNDAEIAAAFRSVLPRISSRIDRAVSELRIEPAGFRRQKTAQLDDVLAILDAAEAELQTSLPYRELRPFHDAVGKRIQALRRELVRSAVAEIVHDDAAIVLVQERREKRVKEKAAKDRLASLAEWFRTLARTSPLTRVCFRRAPPGDAMIAVFPASVPEDRDTTAFVSPLTLYLGEYNYEISRGGRVTNQGSMDILLNPERVLRCPSKDGPTCRLVKGRTENCQ